MKQIEQIRFWPVQQWIVVFVTAFMIFVFILQILEQKRRPQIVHTLGASTLDVKVSWLIQEAFFETASNESGIIYAMPTSTDSLMAIDSNSGFIIWESKRSGARALLTNQDTVFVATSTSMDAYDTSTGELKWSTRLGDGHKAVMSQFDDNVLIVYYGDSQIEIDPKTGDIVSTKPKGATDWISGDVILQTPAKLLRGVDKETGKSLWVAPLPFYLNGHQVPIDVGHGKLIVSSMEGICLLDLQAGVYNWCHPEIHISHIAIDTQSQVGYGMRDDYVLLVIDLQTGAVLGETSFLTSGPIDDEQLNYPPSVAYCDGVVMISFSDSEQTFGLEFKNLR